MLDLIRSIILNPMYNMGVNTYFDTHLIIELLIENHSDEYFKFVSNFTNPTATDIARTTHSQISNLIKKGLATGSNPLLVQMPCKSISYNIHNILSENALWQRI